MVLLLATVLLALLFIAGLINLFFTIPANKFSSWLQIFFPSYNNSKTNSPVASPSSPTTKTKVERDPNNRKDELRKVFSTFDKNGDGFITRQELRESLRNIRIFMTDAEVDDVVAKFDSNGDGLIDFDEFCMLTGEAMGIMNEGSDKEVNLKEAFDVFDKDKDGVISVEELALVLTSLGLREGKKIEECKEMIRKVDLDGDGMVNFEEFKRMMMMEGRDGGKLIFAA